jgi:hypothetical protein
MRSITQASQPSLPPPLVASRFDPSQDASVDCGYAEPLPCQNSGKKSQSADEFRPGGLAAGATNYLHLGNI